MEQFDWMLFLKAAGLAMALEGAAWAGFPEKMRRAALQLIQTPTPGLRIVGLVSLLSGLALCYLGS